MGWAGQLKETEEYDSESGGCGIAFSSWARHEVFSIHGNSCILSLPPIINSLFQSSTFQVPVIIPYKEFFASCLFVFSRSVSVSACSESGQ